MIKKYTAPKVGSQLLQINTATDFIRICLIFKLMLPRDLKKSNAPPLGNGIINTAI